MSYLGSKARFTNVINIVQILKIFLLIILFLALLGLSCCVGFSLVAASRGSTLVVPGLPITVASLVEHRL